MPLSRQEVKQLEAAREDETRQREQLDAVCRGYSGYMHWRFFRELFDAAPIRDICILGVYFGRDISYMATLMGNRGQTDFHITGIDRFDDSPCEDWEEEHKRANATWEQAGFGPAPSLEAATNNLRQLGVAERVTLQRGRAEEFLSGTEQRFDLIYIDTSHDYESTRDTIAAAMRCVRPDGFLAGDDFSDQGTWGVARAVREGFSEFEVEAEWIWVARPAHYRGYT